MHLIILKTITPTPPPLSSTKPAPGARSCDHCLHEGEVCAYSPCVLAWRTVPGVQPVLTVIRCMDKPEWMGHFPAHRRYSRRGTWRPGLSPVPLHPRRYHSPGLRGLKRRTRVPQSHTAGGNSALDRTWKGPVNRGGVWKVQAGRGEAQGWLALSWSSPVLGSCVLWTLPGCPGRWPGVSP